MKNKGLTLLEIMFGIVILVILLVGLLSIFIYCFDLQETSRNTTLALNAARARLEEIRDYNFGQVISTYNGKIFALADLAGVMKTEVSYVVGSDQNLIDIRGVICWKQRGGRIIGNAIVDANGNITDCTTSPVELITAISKK